MRPGRRAVLGGIAGALATAAFGGGIAVARRSEARSADGAPPFVRLGAMANLTHAPMLAGLGSGRIARALAPTRVEARIFRAGPRVAEALIGEAIDAGTAGPAPIVVHHARHAKSGHALRILAGCASGGASLVVGKTSGVARGSDLRGKRVAVTQIGTTQHIALSTYLRDNGLRDSASGGEVVVHAIAPATILDQMKRGELDAAWLPEPWATRLVGELGATRLVDERALWPGGRFSTAVLACLARDAERSWMKALVHALDEEVKRALEDPHASLAEAHAELTRQVGNPGAFKLFERAAGFVDFTSDPLRASVERFGEAAASFGLCAPHPSDGLFG